MRLLIAAIFALAVGWSGYWWFGARAETDAVRAWFDARPDASYTALETRGFPNRFDTTVTGPRFQAGSDALAWGADFLQLLRLSYRNTHYILALPLRQDVVIAGVPAELGTEDARASAVFAADGTLDRAAFVFGKTRLTGGDGPVAWMDALRFALRARDGGYEVGLDADAFRSGDERIIAGLHVEGHVTVAPDGTLAGALEVTSGDWPGLLDMALTARWLDPGMVAAIRNNHANSDPLSLSFRDGRMYLAGLVAGAAPRLPVP